MPIKTHVECTSNTRRSHVQYEPQIIPQAIQAQYTQTTIRGKVIARRTAPLPLLRRSVAGVWWRPRTGVSREATGPVKPVPGKPRRYRSKVAPSRHPVGLSGRLVCARAAFSDAAPKEQRPCVPCPTAPRATRASQPTPFIRKRKGVVALARVARGAVGPVPPVRPVRSPVSGFLPPGLAARAVSSPLGPLCPRCPSPRSSSVRGRVVFCSVCGLPLGGVPRGVVGGLSRGRFVGVSWAWSPWLAVVLGGLFGAAVVLLLVA